MLRPVTTAFLTIALSAPAALAQSDLDGSYPADASIGFDAMHRIASSDLIDPTSAQYKQLVLINRYDGKEFICGWANAKNQMGGYGPFVPFYVEVGAGTANWGYSYQDEFVGGLTRKAFEFVGCADDLGLKPSSN